MSSERNEKTIVIGGGAAGLMATGRLAERGRSVVLAEKNPMLGKKLRITGKGRCNITNECDIEDMLKNVTVNRSFLYSALYTFTNDNLIALLNSYGLETKTERGGRVFPVSDKARDVVEALKKYALKSNVRLMKKEAKELIVSDGAVRGVKFADGTKSFCGSVIVATGGRSYPLTGSTGDGYRFARSVGHTVTDIRPSLVPIVTREKWVKELMGLSLRNVVLRVYDEKKRVVFEELGEMLFTHFGVSGPLVLSASAHMRDIGAKEYVMSIDLKPGLDKAQLDARIRRDFEKNSNRHFINALDELLPKALIPVAVRISGVEAHKPVNQISREERAAFAEVLKGLELHAAGFRPIDEAIVTAGGVNVKEINPSTMESRLVSGLYFAGEVLDVDAYTGGFNLQLAFSTGYLAGDNA